MDNIEKNDLSKEVRAIILSGRQASINLIKSELADCLDEICESLESRLKETGELPVIDKVVCGFTPDQFTRFLEVYRKEDLYEWIDKGADGQIDDLILRFVNFRELNRSGIRTRYPNTFQKWTEQDDEDLRAIYNRKGEAGLDWKDLSEMFGRPANAIKIRLERLGFTLSDPAVKRY